MRRVLTIASLSASIFVQPRAASWLSIVCFTRGSQGVDDLDRTPGGRLNVAKFTRRS